MDNKNASLVDDPEGKIILNESGTSVSVEEVDETDTGKNDKEANIADADALGKKTADENRKG